MTAPPIAEPTLQAIIESIDEIGDDQIAADMRWLVSKVLAMPESPPWTVIKAVVDLSPPGAGRWHVTIYNGTEEQTIIVPIDMLVSALPPAVPGGILAPRPSAYAVGYSGTIAAPTPMPYPLTPAATTFGGILK